jgi:energy-converting hydrogenase B subunit D
MIEAFVLLIVVLMLAAAISTLLLDNLIAATVSASAVSLGLATLFFILRAPDVAMTEAVVGTGLSSLILALGLKRLKIWQLDSTESDNEEAD